MGSLTVNRSHLQKRLLDHYIQNGFENDEDLLYYVKEFLGFNYPTKSFCPEHEAPGKILCDIYFERILFVLLWANRTGGKTQMVSLLNHLDAIFKGPIEIVNAGAALDQADKGYQYFLKSFRNPLLQNFYAKDPQISKTFLKNGSLVQIITASKKGFNGPHPSKVRIDEVELMAWDVLEEGLSMSQSTATSRAQNVLSSTRKYSIGVMQRLLDEQKNRRLSVRSYCIWDMVERCDRECKDDKKYGDCPIFHLCGGKAHNGTGWYRIDDLIEKANNLTKGTFEAQWENKKPSDAPLVFGDYFSNEKHVKSWEELYKIFKVPEFKKHTTPEEWTHVAGIDFGSNFAFLILALEPQTRTWILVDEYFHTLDRRLVEHRNKILESPFYEKLGPIFGDEAAKQDRIELRSLGIKVRPAIKGAGSILLGIDEIKLQMQHNHALDRPKFFVIDSAINIIKEFNYYAWDTKDDGTPDTETPQDNFNHCIDALRYAMHSYGRTGGRYDAVYVEGV